MRAIKVRTAGTFAGPQAQPLQRKNGQVAAALRNSHPPDQWPYSTPSPVTLPAITANSCQNQSAPRRYGPCQTRELDRQVPEYVASRASQLRVQNHHGDSPPFMSPVFWTTAIRSQSAVRRDQNDPVEAYWTAFWEFNKRPTVCSRRRMATMTKPSVALDPSCYSSPKTPTAATPVNVRR